MIESTSLHEDVDLAAAYGHLTARQAARVAAAVFDGDVVVAEDLQTVAVLPR